MKLNSYDKNQSSTRSTLPPTHPTHLSSLLTELKGQELSLEFQILFGKTQILQTSEIRADELTVLATEDFTHKNPPGYPVKETVSSLKFTTWGRSVLSNNWCLFHGFVLASHSFNKYTYPVVGSTGNMKRNTL